MEYVKYMVKLNHGTGLVDQNEEKKSQKTLQEIRAIFESHPAGFNNVLSPLSQKANVDHPPEAGEADANAS